MRTIEIEWTLDKNNTMMADAVSNAKHQLSVLENTTDVTQLRQAIFIMESMYNNLSNTLAEQA
jgi:hypothetical protein